MIFKSIFCSRYNIQQDSQLLLQVPGTRTNWGTLVCHKRLYSRGYQKDFRALFSTVQPSRTVAASVKPRFSTAEPEPWTWRHTQWMCGDTCRWCSIKRLCIWIENAGSRGYGYGSCCSSSSSLLSDKVMTIIINSAPGPAQLRARFRCGGQSFMVWFSLSSTNSQWKTTRTVRA